ncbi:MAG TPA: hypothetical protein VD833_07940 [Vicinamibacterales bacterium]|nr:hypothetical protein [Vicinamibacterales bacterium]
MLPVCRLSALCVIGIGALAFAVRADARQSVDAAAMSVVALPGGLPAALEVLGDVSVPDRGQFLLEVIRRSHDAGEPTREAPRLDALRTLLEHLDRVGAQADAPGDQLPLPLTPKVWTDVVFAGQVAAPQLATAILRSRSASLLYSGLLSLDGATRAWLATQPDLISEINTRYAAAFLVAAPGIRVSGGQVRMPGGPDADPVWEALVGRRTAEPAQFIRAVLMHRDGRLAYFVGTMAQLTDPQRRAAMRLDAPDAGDRVAGARRLLTVFEKVASAWRLADRVFWRPAMDPAQFIADLRTDEAGRPILPGSRRFWRLAFAPPGQQVPSDLDVQTLIGDEPADVPWLCEQVFEEATDVRRRYTVALFASRLLQDVSPAAARDALDAVRAAGVLPALTATLERARIVDVGVIAGAARRAEELSGVRDTAAATRSLQQLQGVLFILTRAVARGTLPPASAAQAITAVTAIEPGARGEYEGRLGRWLVDWLRSGNGPIQAAAAPGPSAAEDPAAADDLDRLAVRLIAGPPRTSQETVEWEGMRYMVDLAAAEAVRIQTFLDEHPRPLLEAADAIARAADVLESPGLTRERLLNRIEALDQAVSTIALDDPSEWPPDVLNRRRDAREALGRLASSNDRAADARLPTTLRTLADDVLARGLLEIVYATALGHADNVAISAGDAAGRHDFGLHPDLLRRRLAWQLPAAGADGRQGWRVTGSLLGLDVRLAEFSLIRRSAVPPFRRPTLNDEDRRLLIESAVLIEPPRLEDKDRNAILAALQRGRARVDGIRSPEDAAAAARDAGFSAARQTLLAWSTVHEAARVGPAFSLGELLWLGLEGQPLPDFVHAWGVSEEPRFGCLCVRMIDRRPWETLSGRWSLGMVGSGFPDLNLRLAELLAGLDMPSSLLGPVLASATLDFVNNVVSRDPDDRRSLVEHVRNLKAERLEEYLALLTTDGPLVPVQDTVDPGPGGKRAQGGVQ